MAEKDLSKLSLEELEKQYKTLKIITSIFLLFLIIMTLCGVYLTFKKGFSVFTVLPICFLPLTMVNITSLKKIKTEIDSRK